MSKVYVKLIRVVIILMLISLLSGFGRCQQTSDLELELSAPTEIAFWHYYGGEQEQALNELLDTFTRTLGKEKGVAVKAARKGSSNELAEMLITAAAGGDSMPDLFSVYPDSAWEIGNYGKLLPLNSLLNNGFLSVFPEEYLLEGRIMGDQNVYILPLAKASEVVAINMSFWQDFANENPRFDDSAEVFANWESISSAAMCYSRWSGGKSMFSIDSLANFIVVGNKQLGIDVLARSGQENKINIDREAMYRLWQIYYPNIITGSFSNTQEFVSDQMSRGDIIAGVISTSAGPYLPTEITGSANKRKIELAVLPYPVFAEAEAVCVQQGAGLAVAKSDADSEKAAVILLQWLIRPEQNVPFAISTGYLPVTRPALQSQLLQEYLERVKDSERDKPGIYMALNAFLEQMSSHDLYSSPAFAGSLQARLAVSESMRSFADLRRGEYLEEINAGKHPDILFDQYVNDAAFEEWYSQLMLDIDRIRRTE